MFNLKTMAKIVKTMTLFDAKGADGYSPVFPCKDMDTVILATSGVGATTTITFKVQGAIAMTNGGSAPTFSSAAAADNHWDYIQIVDLQNGDNIDGDDGVSLAAAGYNLYEVNVSHLDYISVYCDRTAGAFSCVARGFSNDK